MDEQRGFHYTVNEDQLAEYATWSLEEKMRWVSETAHFTQAMQTREERIASYRAYYDRYGWPEHF